MVSSDQLLNHIDEAKQFAKESGVIKTEEDENDYLKAVQAQILRLFWAQSKKLLDSELGLELQHLILQDTVQMAKILKDWSLGDKTLGLKSNKNTTELTAAQYIDQIMEAAEKRKVPVEISLKGLSEMDRATANEEDRNKGMEDLGVPSFPEEPEEKKEQLFSKEKKEQLFSEEKKVNKIKS
jgi:hypothetical protein